MECAERCFAHLQTSLTPKVSVVNIWRLSNQKHIAECCYQMLRTGDDMVYAHQQQEQHEAWPWVWWLQGLLAWLPWLVWLLQELVSSHPHHSPCSPHHFKDCTRVIKLPQDELKTCRTHSYLTDRQAQP